MSFAVLVTLRANVDQQQILAFLANFALFLEIPFLGEFEKAMLQVLSMDISKICFHYFSSWSEIDSVPVSRKKFFFLFIE